MVVLVATLFLAPLSLAPSNTRWVFVAPAPAAALPGGETPAPYTTDWLGRQHRRPQPLNLRLDPMLAGDLVLMYLALIFAATFSNVAFYREILNALKGNPVSVRDGLRFACRQWKIILKWALFAGTVGLVIKMFMNRFGAIGRLIFKTAGVAWSVACVFVIPVLVAHEKERDPLVLVEKAASILKKTWGEGLIAFLGIQISERFLLLAFLLSFWGLTLLAIKLGSLWVSLGLFGVGLIVVAALEYLITVLNAIYICALYCYASHGTVVPPFTKEILHGAWKTRQTSPIAGSRLKVI
jgi:hypothetical protein